MGVDDGGNDVVIDVAGLACGVKGRGLRVQGLQYRFKDKGKWVLGLGYEVKDKRYA